MRLSPLQAQTQDHLTENWVAFGRALRRAGVVTDSARMGLAIEAARWVGVARKEDLAAALEAVMVSRAQDRDVFRAMFDAFFRAPVAPGLSLAGAQPSASSPPSAVDKTPPRVREVLSAPAAAFTPPLDGGEQGAEPDAAMTAGEAERLRQADFNALDAREYRLVERLARDIALPVPEWPGRRTQAGVRGARVHWHRALRRAAQRGGEVLELPRLAPRLQALPLLVLVDVSGSMERYARMLLAFLHAATRANRRRDVFAFGTGLTDLTPVFRLADTDAMLLQAGQRIHDYAGGTRLGHSLAQLRQQHARRLSGRRTVVLVISDGLDTGEPQALAHELQWLRRHTRSLFWLNPLLRFEDYAPLARGAAVLHRHADGMLAIHNLNQLEVLAEALRALLRH